MWWPVVVVARTIRQPRGPSRAAVDRRHNAGAGPALMLTESTHAIDVAWLILFEYSARAPTERMLSAVTATLPVRHRTVLS